MPTYSGTYNFAPSTAELGLNAFARLYIKRAELTEEHLQNLHVSANLLLGEWAIEVPNLWTVDLQTIPLTVGVGTYNVDPTTVGILDAYISLDNGDGTSTDLIIWPISRTEYASFPEKNQQGRPTVFWFDRLINPTVTLWPVPDPSQSYTLKFYRVRQIQDANLISGQNPEIPYRFFEPFAAGLAAKLAEIYRPDLVDMLSNRAATKFQKAAQQDAENAPLFLIPGTEQYWR